MTANPAIIQEMIDHLKGKIDSAAENLAMYKEDFQKDAETLIISYGITSRSVNQAVKMAREKGIRISSLILQTLFPVPEKAIKSALVNIKKVIVPEMNMGQYLFEIERLACGRAEVIGVNKMDTTLVSPKMILEKGRIE
jgi:2-oxoglutarate ferredoxin oxidoreductase subunit alpha